MQIAARLGARGSIYALLAAICLFAAEHTAARAQQMEMEVIPLKYRTAEEVIPLLRPFVSEGGAISGMNNKLIVSTTPANLAEIRKILAAVDGELRRLMVSVKQDASRETGRDEAGASARAVVDDVARMALGERRKRAGDGARVSALGKESSGEEGITQQVQVLEGSSAFIGIGKSVPMHTLVRTSEGRILDMPEYRDLMTGFYVVPRVSGDDVTLEISTQRDRLIDSRTGSAHIQRVATSVSGRLGEWMEIGGVLRQASGGEAGILRGGRRDSRDVRSILIRVDEIK